MYVRVTNLQHNLLSVNHFNYCVFPLCLFYYISLVSYADNLFRKESHDYFNLFSLFFSHEQIYKTKEKIIIRKEIRKIFL